MPQILKPTDVAQRLAAGESAEQIFIGSDGGYKAKLVGPEASAVSVSDAERTADFVISTEAVDRYTDVVSLGGWRTENYTRNPVVLWSHDDTMPAIGRSKNLRIEGKALRSTVEFAPKDVYPLADTIFQLVKGKFINAASVGFIPLKAKSAGADRPFGLNILEQDLLEWSICNIPANPECLADARKLGIDTIPLVGWAERVLDQSGMLLIPRDEIEALRRAAGAPKIVAARTFSSDEIAKLFNVDPKLIKAASEDWKVGASRDLPIANTDTWDGAAAAGRMLDGCGFDGDKPDVAKAKRGFLCYDAAAPTNRGSYKLPFADIVDGELKASSAGIDAAASRLPQTDIPQDVKDNARAVLDHYEAKMKESAAKSAPAKKVKSLWHVAWLADILMDLDCLEDCVEFEAALEEDNSAIPQKLMDALKALGQILIDMTVEEVTELLTDSETGEDVVMLPAPVEMNASKLRLSILRQLAKVQKPLLETVLGALMPKEKGGVVDLLAARAAIEATLKAGKVLSAANEKALRDAHDMITKGCDVMKGILDAATSDESKAAPRVVVNLDDAGARRRRANALKLSVAAAVLK